MRFLSSKYNYYSELSKDVFIEIINKKTDQKRFKLYIGGVLASENKMFTGTINSKSFELIRNYQLFNSFRPSILGNFDLVNDKLNVKIEIKIKKSFLIIFGVIMLLLNVFSIGAIQLVNGIKYLNNEKISSSNELILVFANLLLIIVIFISFYIEKSMVRKDLIKLLKLKEY